MNIDELFQNLPPNKSASAGAAELGVFGVILPTIFLEIGRILAFSTPNITRSKEGAVLKKSLAPPIFYAFSRPCSAHTFKKLGC